VPPAPPAVGTPGNPLRISDPRTLRALAHPARLAILQFLALEGPATATECAAVAGLSPSACSYHLRMLAQHGFVEADVESAADGRHRPWRARIISFSWSDEPGATPAMRLASQMLDETMRAQSEELRGRYLDRRHEYPAPWRRALGSQSDVLHVRPEELTALKERLVEIFGEFRRLGLDDRPPGTGRVYVTLEFLPWFEPDGVPD
jgi:DNA-binding transcriptional ArsR family regulator